MRLIDEKGRFLGKINLIDLVVIFLLIFLVTAVCYRLLGPKIATSPAAKGEVTALIKCTLRPESVAKAVPKGNLLIYGTTYIDDAKIADVSYLPADYITVDSQGNVHLVKHPVLKDIFITIRAQVNTNASILKVGTQELCLGKKFTVKTHTIELDGTVEQLTITK